MKKLSTLLLCLLLLVTCAFAGCASFAIDKVKYYNEVIVKVGDSNITRYDLLTAYSSYGYKNYVTMYGLSESEALSRTLDTVVDRECLYQYALSCGDKYKPTEYQVNQAIQELFDSIDSDQMESYIEKAKTILNIEADETTTSDSEDEDTAYLKSDYYYKKRATIEKSGDEYKINYIYEDEEPEFSPIIATSLLSDFNSSTSISEILKAYKNHLKSDLEITEKENATIIYNKVISMLADNLMDYEYYLRDENNKPYSKSTEDLLYRYFERSLASSIESVYLENIRIDYLKNENLSIVDLVEDYRNLTISDYNTYNDDLDDYKSKMKGIGTEGDSVLYHPDLTDGTQFGYFLHTLIPFTTDETTETGVKSQTSRIEELDNYEDTPKAQAEKELAYSAILSETSAKPRNLSTGLVDENQVAYSIYEIIDEYNTITKISDYTTRLNKFVEFMFKYSTDTATLATGMPYVVGSYDTEKDETFSTNSEMQEEFTDEAISLMKTNQKGAMSIANKADLTNLCITSYGIHFIFYVGDVNSFDINYSDISRAYMQSDCKNNDSYGQLNLYTKEINPITHKTYFDLMFDKVYPAKSDEENYTSNTGYTSYEESIVENMQSKVTKYQTKINGTKTTLK